jgi:hypothetical protein
VFVRAKDRKRERARTHKKTQEGGGGKELQEKRVGKEREIERATSKNKRAHGAGVDSFLEEGSRGNGVVRNALVRCSKRART